MGPSIGSAADDGSRRRGVALVLAVGLIFVLGLSLRIDGFNGAWYWRWSWREPVSWWPLVLLALPLPAILLAVREPLPHTRWGIRARLALLMVASFALQWLGMLSYPAGLERLQAIVASPVATSYFTDARKIGDLAGWLSGFHTAQLELHSSTHPPGPILFYYVWLKLFGASGGALAGATAIGLLATLGIPAMWSFAGLWTARAAERLMACALYALLPALIVLFPEFDQVYPVIGMLMLSTWMRALGGSRGQAIALGATTFLATLFAYNLLVLGVFMAIHAAWFITRQRPRADAVGRIAAAAAVAAGSFFVLHLLLRAATGYDAPLSFAHALTIQTEHAARLDRPWHWCALLDPYDFLLGAGMLVAPLVLLFFLGGRGDPLRTTATALAWIGLATILVVDLSGLLRAETARVWLFLQPLVVVPAAIALCAFAARGRHAVLLLQWLVAAVLTCRVSFIIP